MDKKLIVVALIALLAMQIALFGLDDCDKCSFEVKGEEYKASEVLHNYFDECLTTDENLSEPLLIESFK